MTPFATRFRRGDRLLGALVRMPNENLVELAGLVGLDYLVIDTEHGPGDQLALTHHVVAAQANGIAVIVRVGRPDEVLRVLDLGVHGILAPHVSSVDQARAYLDAVHYPPLGRRGFAAYTRAGNYGLRTATEHLDASRESLLITMIEDPDGLAAAGDIAGLDGVDGLMLGPADLACELGAVGRPDDPRIAAAGQAVRDRARAAGIVPVSIVGAPEAAERAFAAGDTAVMFNVQLLLGQLFTRLAASGPEPAEAAPEPLVLLPGMLGDATVWEGVATELGRVAEPRFDRIDLDASIPGMADSVLAVAPERFALAGHSLGAIVALEIVRRAPERVTRLALVNASGRGPSDDQQAAWSTLLEHLDSDGFDGVAADLARATLPPTRRADPALVAAGERMARAVGPDGLRRQLRAQQARTSYLDDVAAIDVPVLIVSGALDEVCPPARQDELLAHCPRARLVTLDDAGHMAPLERPAEVAAALRRWLAE
ncbi:MAG TPA: aldolase/citrate lyase family protein [Jatrophihabitans sp.]|jgi:4-hydroxy-2-oxoheptanedioate aldolase|uniref:aldolase/citrate lyase family protein n=1 Tax=Jatrophihabitans sp. TaxID=1932789 RepID=UPI002E032672|nr:aldolase/citrate lyase family protein [Jatrophihabitans sp.]